MRMFKGFIIAVALAIALPCFSQVSTIATFTTKTFAKATSRSDTSVTAQIGAYPNISVQTTTAGTDSAAIAVHIDALINGLWSNDICVAQSVALGRAAGHTLAGSAHTGQVDNFILRDRGRIADLLTNAAQIRIRNVLTAGAGDSTSATSYTQKIVMQKVTW